MGQFIISNETKNIDFHERIIIDPCLTVHSQLNRRQLFQRSSGGIGNPLSIQKIIEQNSSLRIDFGWSFESETQFKSIIVECIEKISPKYNIDMIDIISDMRCSWIGFLPLDKDTRMAYANLSMYEMILFNNEIIAFEEEIVKYIVGHRVFRQHALTRDSRYRFNYLKSIREDADALEDAYWQYLTAIHDTVQIPQIPRDIIEQDLGCHFLKYPVLFSGLLLMTKLKGELL